MARHATGLPAELLIRPIRLIRPRDAAGVYAPNPWAQLRRLVDRGLLAKVARGYFAVVPAERVGDPTWQPPLVATAWAIAAVDYGVELVAVCGPSAARHHGLIPRELATAFVAVPKQRPNLTLPRGEVVYVRRDVDRLDLERWVGELGEGWVTTLEQTVLDLLTRPNRWQLTGADLRDVARTAAPRVDRELLERLADEQDRAPARARFLQLADDARPG